MRLREKKEILRKIKKIKYRLEKNENKCDFINPLDYTRNILIEIKKDYTYNDYFSKKISQIIKKICKEEQIKNYEIICELEQLEKFIEDIEIKLEVLFLPYKEAMWDSFDSVWRAVKEDNNCNCSVVPIQYYELDANHRPIKLCYEGNKFAEYLNVIPFENYDLEKIKPDIIYIHNPYDDCNTITTIDPRYYSRNLKKYTDMLVYIPYFIAGCYENSDEHAKISNLPVLINSDRIIVQSDIHQKLFIENGYDYQKILNIGSPKFDAILNCNIYENEICENLKKIINGKTVFLLSTGIYSLLNNEKWADDIEKILLSFIDSKSSALIWRVHPLTEITIKTMKPNLMETYLELKQLVFSSNSITFDENTNIYSSISISDALISDYSSIMFQYMATEKPILGLIENELLKGNRQYAIDYLGNYFECDGIDIDKFKNIILNKVDYKKDERIMRLRYSIKNLDGKCGEKIHLNIKSQILF